MRDGQMDDGLRVGVFGWAAGDEHEAHEGGEQCVEGGSTRLCVRGGPVMRMPRVWGGVRHGVRGA
jgi:hypothetical protein